VPSDGRAVPVRPTLQTRPGQLAHDPLASLRECQSPVDILCSRSVQVLSQPSVLLPIYYKARRISNSKEFQQAYFHMSIPSK